MTTATPTRLEADPAELHSILEIVKSMLSAGQYKIMETAVNTILWFQNALKEKGATVARLKRLMFGGSNDKSKKQQKRAKAALKKQLDLIDESGTAPDMPATAVEEDLSNAKDGNTLCNDTSGSSQSGKGKNSSADKKKGHGKRSMDAFDLSKITCIMHEDLAIGDVCPKCCKGKVYNYDPETILVLKGQFPIRAEAYSAERLRCNACDAIFRAKWRQDNLTFKSFSNIIDALGFSIVLEKRPRKSHVPSKLKISRRKHSIPKVHHS